MIEPATCEPQARVDVSWRKVRHLFDNLLRGETVRQEIQNVTDPNPHPTNARTSTALLQVHRDAIHQFSHAAISEKFAAVTTQVAQ
jgi:hypothetical protein